ncbi:hypothetical protein EJV47_10090 [Hymenobacter gummosus]|uniref:Uncharacterized protein n=1 Tax=Hymenobacter gummosus TaxID=1776032 RepID=A0A3S0H9G8_9BACT|nr:hypothetical protein [Hymenobacter gummosus]RTQ49984.1 hypothetical protein EJV47_10090 [Hymenobacter gummosus]
MKPVTFTLLLLAVTLVWSGAEAAPLRPDEPEAKSQPKKTVKPKKKRVSRAVRRRESSYGRAMRRNELLREPAEKPAEQ